MEMRAGRPVTEVAVGVLIDRERGAYLLGSRPEGKPCAGYWEFPGGKLEKGETVHEALVRELREELGIETGPSAHWFVMEHDYPHAYVRLHFRRAYSWSGEMRGLEHQLFSWFDREHVPQDVRLLPMDSLVICRIFLPEIIAVVDPDRLPSPEELRASGAQAVLPLREDEAARELAQAAGLEVLDPASALLARTEEDARRPGPAEVFAVGLPDGPDLLADERNTLPVYLAGTKDDLPGLLARGAQGAAVWL